ncbi:MAG: CDP-diacylglycerol--serine O-phosphatidyltransferase [Verrucomicrobiota bacterium]
MNSENEPSPSPQIDGSQASRIYLLPNLMTAGNLFCGFFAIIKCIQARFNVMLSDDVLDPTHVLYTHAVMFILGGMLFDSLDGRLARMGGRESLFGKEFDSIADIVTFGIAPALMMLFLLFNPGEAVFFKKVGLALAFIYLLCAGIRLARFNVITHPSVYPANFDRTDTDFIGLPVPAAAGMISTIVLMINKHGLEKWAFLLPFFMLFISYLMISPIRYPSFKKIDWTTKIRIRSFILLLCVGLVLFLYQWYGLVLVFVSYLFYGVVRYLLMLRRTRFKKKPASKG